MPQRILVAFVLLMPGLLACTSTPTRAPSPAAESAGAPDADVVVLWNQIVFHAAEAEDRFLTLKGLRTAAMMHLAMHDAINSIEPRFETYVRRDEGAAGHPLAAAASAAFEVVVRQYPDQRALLEESLEDSLVRVPAGMSGEADIAAGIATGRRAAERILAAREGDGWNAEAEYHIHPMAPGVYAEFSEHSGTPEGFVFGAGWAVAKPFVLESTDQFMAPPPPDIDSDAYTAAFREVKSVGRFESPDRTDDQSHLAMWWKEFVESSHNRLARELSTWRQLPDESLDLWQSARLFALLEVSIYDAYLDVFHNKFHYNHWRPYTAIRWAEHDGNPDTEPDPQWNNLHRHTYAFPSYPSAHGTACASAMSVLADVLGDDRPFRMTIQYVDRAGPLSDKIVMKPPSRSFDSFAAAAEECSLSRVYLGIHFRYDSEAGTELGREIGEYVVNHALRPSR